MSSRSAAMSVHKLLDSSSILQKFGPESRARLLSDLKISEFEALDFESESTRTKLKEADYIVDAEKARKLIDIIIQVKCPVVMEFHLVIFVTNKLGLVFAPKC